MTLQAYGTLDPALFSELGVDPLTASAVIAAGGAIGALLGIRSNEADWSDAVVFTDNMRKLHSAMLGLQCILGGAQAGQPLVDSYGNTICPGGTLPACKISAAQLNQWRTLRDGFGAFWASSQSGFWKTVSTDVGQRGKQYFSDFISFYKSIQPLCAGQGAALPAIPSQLEPPDSTPGWLKYAAWGLGAVAVIAVANTLKGAFSSGSTTVKVEASPKTALGEMHMRRILLDEQGRDAKGTLWGKGDPVFYIVDDATGIRTRLRARNAFDAANRFIEYLSDMHNLPRGLRRGARGW